MERGRGIGAGGAQAPRAWRMRLCPGGLLIFLLLIAPGCTGLREWAHKGFKVGPNYCTPPAPLAPEWVEANNGTTVPAPPEDYGWWHVFRDPALDGLIETAYRQNL